jgi:hypothetical protein
MDVGGGVADIDDGGSVGETAVSEG